jgi:hypothetical protein
LLWGRAAYRSTSRLGVNGAGDGNLGGVRIVVHCSSSTGVCVRRGVGGRWKVRRQWALDSLLDRAGLTHISQNGGRCAPCAVRTPHIPRELVMPKARKWPTHAEQPTKE